MTDIILFAFNQIFTETFWLFVGCSFLGVLLLTYRNSYRSDLFAAAVDWSKSGRKTKW